MKYHNFSVEIATETTVHEAILLQNIAYWIEKNIVNNKNFHDGYYWTFNSVEDFQLLFPYFSYNQIKNNLQKLRDRKILGVANYNKKKFDKTLWYTIIDSSMLQRLIDDTIFQKWVDETHVINEIEENEPVMQNELIDNTNSHNENTKKHDSCANSHNQYHIQTHIQTTNTKYTSFNKEVYSASKSEAQIELFEDVECDRYIPYKVIELYNQKVIELKNKNVNKEYRPSIHKININNLTKNIINLSSMIQDIQQGSFYQQKLLKTKIDQFYVQKTYTVDEICNIITNYFLLYDPGYSYTTHIIDQKYLARNLQDFFYNQKTGKSYFLTCAANKVVPIATFFEEKTVVSEKEIQNACIEVYNEICTVITYSKYKMLEVSNFFKKTLSILCSEKKVTASILEELVNFFKTIIKTANNIYIRYRYIRKYNDNPSVDRPLNIISNFLEKFGKYIQFPILQSKAFSLFCDYFKETHKIDFMYFVYAEEKECIGKNTLQFMQEAGISMRDQSKKIGIYNTFCLKNEYSCYKDISYFLDDTQNESYFTVEIIDEFNTINDQLLEKIINNMHTITNVPTNVIETKIQKFKNNFNKFVKLLK